MALIKPPLEKLLLQIETKPDITGKDETKVLLTLFPLPFSRIRAKPAASINTAAGGRFDSATG